MAPAFNPWPDLRSYRIEKLAARLDEISARTAESPDDTEVGMYYEKPVIILCVSDNADNSNDEDKWSLIYDFIEKEGYELTYTDDMFIVYE